MFVVEEHGQAKEGQGCEAQAEIAEGDVEVSADEQQG